MTSPHAAIHTAWTDVRTLERDDDGFLAGWDDWTLDAIVDRAWLDGWAGL